MTATGRPLPGPAARAAPLGRDARHVVAVNAVNALGGGFTLPFLLIYLHQVRDLALPLATLLVSLPGAIGAAVGPLAGTLTDRLGPRRVMLGCLLLSAAGTVVLSQVSGPPTAVLAIFLLGLGWSGTAPNALLASATLPAQRQRVFALQAVFLNAGSALGAVGGGLIADLQRPRTFELLYAIDATSYLLAAVMLLLLRQVGGAVPRPPAARQAGAGGWRQVLADPGMRWLTLLFTLVVFAGYAQLGSGVPAYATGVSGVSARVVGLAFAVGTAVVVSVQLPVLRLLPRWRRTRAIAGFGVLTACAWTLLGSSSAVGGHRAAALVIAAAAVFALGSTLWAPTGNAIVNDLAPRHLRGRYNALATTATQVSLMTGSVFAGLLLGAGLAGAYIVALALVGGAVVAAALRLERHLGAARGGLAPAGGAPPDRDLLEIG